MDANWSRVAELLDQLYASTDELETLFPGRKFTLDGHLVGSVGEVVAAYMFGLELNPASTIAHDARAADGRHVEIKLTQEKRISIRHEPEHLIVLTRPKGSKIDVVYNGPGDQVWPACGKMQKNGQRRISITKLKMLNATVLDAQRLKIRNQSPV
ncbi:MAG: hypothetical protein N4A65_06625 [Cohaesibacter sp.]|jgi:hypothetical protein|nr:hypothetical protein [Cohaesibacter sp.]